MRHLVHVEIGSLHGLTPTLSLLELLILNFIIVILRIKWKHGLEYIIIIVIVSNMTIQHYDYWPYLSWFSRIFSPQT